MKQATISKHIDIFGFPMDLGAGRRGVDMGPSAMLISQISERLQILGYKVIDDGNIQIEIPPGEHTLWLRFEDTPPRIAGKIISVITLFLLLALHFVFKRNRSPQ